MERVEGIGGFFFAARDPTRVGQWYAEHLGVDEPPAGYDQPEWQQQAGPTIFAAFHDEGDSSHLGRQGWGLNFRVRDLDAMVRQLEQAGIAVEVDPETYPNGRFAQLRDPEGNVVQLWQPR